MCVFPSRSIYIILYWCAIHRSIYSLGVGKWWFKNLLFFIYCLEYIYKENLTPIFSKFFICSPLCALCFPDSVLKRINFTSSYGNVTWQSNCLLYRFLHITPFFMLPLTFAFSVWCLQCFGLLGSCGTDGFVSNCFFLLGT